MVCPSRNRCRDRDRDWPSEIVDIYDSLPHSQHQSVVPLPSLLSPHNVPSLQPHTNTPLSLYSSWPPKPLINACVFHFSRFFLRFTNCYASALEGVYYHAEGTTPFRLGSTRRERHFILCAYPFSRYVFHCSLFTSTGNFIIVRALKAVNTSRVADTVIPLLTAWPTGFSLCWRRVPRGAHVPVRIPL